MNTDSGTMTETTLQKVIVIFAVVFAIVTVAVVGTFCLLVIRDGNDPLVSQAFTDLSSVAQNAFYTLAAVIVGKPIASGVLQFFQGKAIQASTQNVPVAPATLPVQQVNQVNTTPVASSGAAVGPFPAGT